MTKTVEEILEAIKVQKLMRNLDGSLLVEIGFDEFERLVQVLERAIEQRDHYLNGIDRPDAPNLPQHLKGKADNELLDIAKGKS